MLVAEYPDFLHQVIGNTELFLRFITWFQLGNLLESITDDLYLHDVMIVSHGMRNGSDLDHYSFRGLFQDRDMFFLPFLVSPFLLDRGHRLVTAEQVSFSFNHDLDDSSTNAALIQFGHSLLLIDEWELPVIMSCPFPPLLDTCEI